MADGFPRTVAQAAALEERCRIDRVVSISMREDALVRKLLGRRVCPVCNISYNVAHIDEDNFYMPAVLPDNPACSCYKRVDRLVRREVRRVATPLGLWSLCCSRIRSLCAFLMFYCLRL